MEAAARHPAPERCLFGDGYGLLPKWAKRYSVQGPKTKPFQLRGWSNPSRPAARLWCGRCGQWCSSGRATGYNSEVWMVHTLAPTPTKDA
jgi:hypothetical protein